MTRTPEEEEIADTVLTRLEDMAPALTVEKLDQDQYEVHLILSSPSLRGFTPRTHANLQKLHPPRKKI